MSYGHVLGGIKIRKSAKTGKWTADQLELVNTLSEQLSVALENARLLEEAQRRAAREQAIGEITASISGSSDVDTILRTAIQELGNKIGNTEVIFELGTE
jgi:GAF domain-containing protein